MNTLFIVAGAIAVFSAALAISRSHAIHALLYMVVSLLAIGFIFFTLGAPFAAALEVIINAGAIMVLFVFVIMMLNLGGANLEENYLLKPSAWAGPILLTLILALELIYVMLPGTKGVYRINTVPPKELGMCLFGPYVLGVELASMLLLAGLVGAYHMACHIGMDKKPDKEAENEPSNTC
jgi:NADH-quinone oxidoreductase subunit J